MLIGILVVVLTVLLYPQVLGQSAELEQECHILKTLDTLETRLREQDARLKLQEVLLQQQNALNDQQEDLLVQQNNLLEQQTASLESQEARIRELEANFSKQLTGRVDETYKTPTVVFTARDVTESDVTKGKVILFTTIVSNEGGAYDSNTGYFTAPYDGLYQFHATVCSKLQKHVYVHLVAAGTALAGTYKYNANTDGSCTSISGVTRLSSGDNAHVEGAGTLSGALYAGDSYQWPSFSGMLVHT